LRIRRRGSMSDIAIYQQQRFRVGN